MLADELKAHIIKNNKIEIILNQLNCTGVKEHNAEWRCGLPNDTSNNRVSIKKNTLKVSIY
ncbi:MAG TPA: hypothetical protein GX707_01990, partial [Epulopiscium sp.]|nr:hypothetical protein [Candidatus Epulonipiscium sp.]